MQELSGEPHTQAQPSLLNFPYWMCGPGYEATIRSTLHPGRRIPINALSAGRRGKSVLKGKAKLPPGRLKSNKVATYSLSRCVIPNHKLAPGKRLHSLNIAYRKEYNKMVAC